MSLLAFLAIKEERKRRQCRFSFRISGDSRTTEKSYIYSTFVQVMDGIVSDLHVLSSEEAS